MAGCLCGCGKFATQRGRAKTCMQKLRIKVLAGVTTEEAEMAAGHLLPRKDSRLWRNYPKHG